MKKEGYRKKTTFKKKKLGLVWVCPGRPGFAKLLYWLVFYFTQTDQAIKF